MGYGALDQFKDWSESRYPAETEILRAILREWKKRLRASVSEW
jgi:hypothetical protein